MNKASLINKTIGGLMAILFKTKTAFAQGYQMLEPQVLTPAASAQDTVSLEKYIAGMYQTMFALIFATCIIYLVYGGVSYILTDVVSTKDAARRRINNAFYGLAIALSSYLILYIINPDLVKIGLNFLSSPSGASGN